MERLASNLDGNVKTVFHLADIHIKHSIEEHAQYRQVFRRLVKRLNEDPDDAVIVVCGDIVHNKTWLRPECIQLCKELFMALAEIADVIIIIGNHDCNPNNSDALDSITPILSDMRTKNHIHVLNENKLYEYQNIIFGVTTVYAKQVTPCVTDAENKDRIKIGLYHGKVIGAKMQNGTQINDSTPIRKTDFSDYDLVLLGDIHKYQYLDQSRKIAYPSSLIQQDFGEDLQKHGFIKWNLQTLQPKFFRVRNEYGFVTLNVREQGLIDYLPEIIPKYASIRLLYKGVNGHRVEKIKDELIKKHKPLKIEVSEIEDNTQLDLNIEINGENDQKRLLNDIRDKDEVIEMVKSYCLTHNYEEQTVSRIIPMLREYLDKIDYNFDRNIKRIKLLTLEFDNLYCYGVGNRIDFTKFKGIKGIIERNGQGKSSIINAILFAIFDKFYRGEKWGAINQVRYEDASSVIKLLVNKDVFRIERRFTINGKKNYNKRYEIKVYKNDVLVTDDDKAKTNQYIYENICSYDDLIYSNIILQKNGNFLDYKDTDKKKYIEKIFNLDVIKFLYDSISKTKRDTLNKIKIKKSDKAKFDHEKTSQEHDILLRKKRKLIKEIKEAEGVLDSVRKEHAEIKFEDEFDLEIMRRIKRRLDKDEITRLQQEIAEYGNIEQEHKLFTDKKKSDKKRLFAEKEELLLRLHNVSEEGRLERMKEEKAKLVELIKRFSNRIKTVPESVETDYELYSELEEKIAETKRVLIEQKRELKTLSKLVSSLENHSVNTECWACMSNDITFQKIGNEVDQEVLYTDYKYTGTLLNQLRTELKAIDSYRSNYEQDKLNKKLQMKIELLSKDLEHLNEKIGRCEENKITRADLSRVNKELVAIKRSTLPGYDVFQNLVERLRKVEADELELRASVNNYDRYVDLLKKYGGADDVLKRIAEFEKLIRINEESIEKMKKRCDEYQESIYRYKHRLEQIDSLNLEIQELEYQKSLIESIHNIFNRDQFMDFYLNKNILPSITRKANEILSNFSNLRIKQKTSNEKFIIQKIINGTALGASNFCGFDDFMVNLALRISINILNKNLKTDFLIVDEGFSACDNANSHKLKAVFNYIQEHYDWCIMISHIDAIKNQFNSLINIDTRGGYSLICN